MDLMDIGLSAYVYIPKFSVQNLLAAHFYFKMQLQNKEKTSCENAHWQVSSCFAKDSYLTVLVSKGLGWHSREAGSSQAATKWQIHLNELFHIVYKFHHLMCAWILFP